MYKPIKKKGRLEKTWKKCQIDLKCPQYQKLCATPHGLQWYMSHHARRVKSPASDHDYASAETLFWCLEGLLFRWLPTWALFLSLPSMRKQLHKEDLPTRNGILILPTGTEIIPSWGIRARSLLLNRCPVCLKAERLGLYVCVQGVHPIITESGGLAVVPRMSLLRPSGKRISPRTNRSTSVT